MSFVEWVTVLALGGLTLVGVLSGVATLMRRRFWYGSYVANGWSAALFGLLYLGGGLVALLALAILVL